MYKAAHGYISAWRQDRSPATLLPANIDFFAGRVRPALLEYVRDVATHWVKPLALYPPVRSPQLPYSSVRGNPDRTSDD